MIITQLSLKNFTDYDYRYLNVVGLLYTLYTLVFTQQDLLSFLFAAHLASQSNVAW